MITGTRGTFVISWSQAEVDGLTGAPVSALEIGAIWRWSGTPIRVDGPNDVLPLNGAEGAAELHRRAARTVRRLVGRALPPVRPQEGPEREDPIFDRAFTVTDGRVAYSVILIDVPDIARPLLMFHGRVPPRDRDLWVIDTSGADIPVNRITETPLGVICFTPGTCLRTPDGPRPVETLREGDRIDTCDDGPQEILWIGSRRISGARLYAMPELRPIRVSMAALGDDRPDGDLLVSPRHKLLVRGDAARALFNAPEVLIAAEDLINDRTIRRDHAQRQVTYIHIMLPRHQIVWANGVETESFHPASTALETIETEQRDRLLRMVPGIDTDPHGYGATARRELTASEAAILRHEAPTPH